MTWTAAKIRAEFLAFFKKRDHLVLPSASLIPQDPTVLLTLAGMLPFKPIFMGLEPVPENPRRATCQKCIRMNDLQNVGHTSRHHTFFEMLGNFSFGDYFKEEAIAYAWELLTDIFKIPKERLFIAVFKEDQESYDIWHKKIGILPEKIFKLDEDNNFWAAGPTGPCGPCSEIYYDFGEKYGCGKPGCGPGCDCERFLEIWNLVFMEFNRDENWKLTPLPKKNIDTGMGLERIAAVLQGVHSNFETDIFSGIIKIIENLSEGSMLRPKEYSRIIADHIRASIFLLADRVLPSNEKRGYVLRKIIRRTQLYGYKFGIKKMFLGPLAEFVINSSVYNYYPELKSRSSDILEIIRNEEQAFWITLEKGVGIVQEMIDSKIRADGVQAKFTGADAFKLYDTFGFPYEMTRELVEEQSLAIEDEAGFERELNAQRIRSRNAVVFDGVYGEKPKGGEGMVAKTEEEKIDMARHHTATHLLHAALRQVLGDQAEQSGSLVMPDRLRFDYKHPKALTEEEKEKIERLVNAKIREDLKSEIFETNLEEARKLGAMALFNEKYGDKVRVIKIGDFSLELCGGTHVTSTGQIGCFKILADSAIAAGYRRIEGLAGQTALDHLNKQEKELKRASEILKVTPDLIKEKIEKLQGELKAREKELSNLRASQARDWNSFPKWENGLLTVSQAPFEKIDDLRKVSDLALSEKKQNAILFFVSGDARQFVGRISEDLIGQGYKNNIFDDVYQEFGGRGGGRPGMVQGSFSQPADPGIILGLINGKLPGPK